LLLRRPFDLLRFFDPLGTQRLVWPTAGSDAPPYGGVAEAVSSDLAARGRWSAAAKLCSLLSSLLWKVCAARHPAVKSVRLSESCWRHYRCSQAEAVHASKGPPCAPEEPQPAVTENETAGILASAVGADNFNWEAGGDGADDPATVILHIGVVPPKYLRVVSAP
jgi:hypothetical protein